ncbi:MAG TPA: BON domain-containing protein [Steroidobacteraceae bacterium]|nr:BON domain-containing protein [Steroidobacteraceae bacterium]
MTTLMAGCAVYQKCGFRGCPGDAEITAAVQADFAQHPAIMPPNIINIRCLDGVVYLSGLVATDLQRQVAASVALQTPGVKRVVNSIGLSNDSGF